MSVQVEFSRHADEYSRYSLIQQRVVNKLLDDLGGEKPLRILDLGCGNGALYKALSWEPEHFVGIDFAPRMLELHPKGEGVECVYGDFNDPALFEHLQFLDFDRVFSASALQWADDLDALFGRIAAFHAPLSLAIFTSGTFKTLHETARLPALLRSVEEVRRLAKRHFAAQFETVEYSLAFESTREMLRYIKRSGVSGRRNVLTLKETKRLMESYPLNYLEFEVLYIVTH